MRISALLLFLTPILAMAGSPADALAAALADARKNPVHTYRYFWIGALPEVERVKFARAFSYHTNTLSREAYIANPRLVHPEILRVDAIDYAWDLKVWEKLASVDPYFHHLDTRVIREVELQAPAIPAVKPAPVAVEDKVVLIDGPRDTLVETKLSEVEPGQKYYLRQPDRTLLAQTKSEDAPPAKTVIGEIRAPLKDRGLIEKRLSKDPVLAPWVDKEQYVELCKILKTEAPLLRADWFLYWTSHSFGRQGCGYLEFMGLNSRADVEKLAGFNAEVARRRRKEMMAVVDESGVSVIGTRQLEWQATLGGTWWRTFDSEKRTGRANVFRLLDGDFEHEAEEIYFSLPNDLFGFFACDRQGTKQERVPQGIALDHVSTSNDKNIYTGPWTCARCHVEGIRPIDDWVRRTYDGNPRKLKTLDPFKKKRFDTIFFTDLPAQVKRDQDAYAAALKKVNGLTPAENAHSYALAWTNYYERRLNLHWCAYELGCTEEHLRHAIEKLDDTPDADSVLGALLGKNRTIHRADWEEVYALAQEAIRRYKP